MMIFGISCFLGTGGTRAGDLVKFASCCCRRRRRESGRRLDALLVNKERPMALGGVVATEQGINDRVCICTAIQYDGTGQA